MHRTWRILPAFMLVYVLLYAGFGLQSPFLPALLHERGLPAGELGVLLATSTAIRVFAGPAIAQSADRLQRHTFILCACALLAALAGLGFVLLDSFLPLLAVALLQAAMLAPIVPVSDALATTATNASLSDGRTRFDYGWIRAVGSAAFVIGATVGGWAVAKTGLATMPWLAGTVLAIGGATSLLLPGISATWSGGSASFARDWAVLLRLAIYRRMLIVAALVEGSHALQDSFAVIRWREAGIDLRIIGLLWSESVMAEVLVFLVLGPRLLRLLAPRGACMVAAAAGAVRWTVSAFATAPFVLAVVQPLHGLTFALLHLACMRLIVWVVPARLAATAQAVYGTACIGLATALLTLLSGLLYGRIGGHAFLVMAALCLLALPLCGGLRQRDHAT